MKSSEILDTEATGLSERAANLVVARLEDRICSGELTDGEPLPAERELIADYGVSRTVIREAVNTLAAKGLIDARPRYRPVVRRPDYATVVTMLDGIVRYLIGEPGGVRNLFASRIVIEGALARMAAVDAKKNDIENLRSALRANGEMIDDSEAFYATDTAFHGVLYTIPDIPIFPAVHKAYTDWLDSHWKQMPRLPERNRENFAAHTEIFEAILNRDPDGAENALKRHLTDAWEQVKATFGDDV